MDINVPPNGKFFFPQRKTLQLFNENYSPDLLQKITYAGVNCNSFETAVDLLNKLMEFKISTTHIQRLTIRSGEEMVKIKEDAVKSWKDIPSVQKPSSPVATVSIDGGRAQTRAENEGPGIHHNCWRETKIACLQLFDSNISKYDPHPLLPTIFTKKDTVSKLMSGLKGHGHVADNQLEIVNNHDLKEEFHIDEENNKYISKPIKRISVATVAQASDFGNMVLHQACHEGMHLAERKAFLGDGDKKIWGIYTDYFNKDWVPILDYIHALEYVFSAAKIIGITEQQHWSIYLDTAQKVWQGDILKVIKDLNAAMVVTENPKDKKELAGIINYLDNNADKMKYPTYRKQGLPISSCHVESLIKQFNLRVKSTEKFWNESSLKAVLAFKAAILSDDNSWDCFWEQRYLNQLSTKRSYTKRNQILPQNNTNNLKGESDKIAA